MSKIQTLQEYAKLNLKTDVLLLADVYENFRTTCKKTSPGLAFLAKITEIDLELLSDIVMVLFIES